MHTFAATAAVCRVSACLRPWRAALLTALALLGLAGTPAQAASDTAATLSANQGSGIGQLRQQSLALARLAEAYQAADADAQAALLAQLQSLAESRAQLLARLSEQAPAAVLSSTLPAWARNALPTEVAALVEESQTQEGELEVSYEDYPDGHHVLRQVLKTPAGERLTLKFADQAPSVPAGSQVKVQGWRVADKLVLQGADLQTLALNGTGTTGATVQANTFGEQKTLVMLVNFQDAPGNQPWTLDQANSLVFDTVNQYYQDDSYQQTWLSGDVVGWFTLALDSTSCDSTAIAQQADAAATQAGVVLADYAHKVYLFPTVSSCGWSGLGTVGGSPSRSWINGSFTLQTVGHELGHNLGLYHAHSLECGTSALGSNCQSSEYGDRNDIMGNVAAGHMSAFQKQQLGWLDYGNSPSTTLVTADGTYLLTPYELDDGGSKALMIPAGTDAVSGQPQYYYLEYRQALGADSFLAGNSNVLNGVVVRTAVAGDLNSSYLLDMTPASNSIAYYDWQDYALPSGRSYVDETRGVTITTDWTDGQQASVTVTLGSVSCQAARPTLSLTPAQGPWVAAGSQVSYQLTLTNQDSSACGSSQFDLQAQLPSGWVASFDKSSLTMAPGDSASATLTVSSASGAQDGYYDISLQVSEGAETLHQQTGLVTYVVSNPVNSAPLAVNDSLSVSSGVSGSLNVLANDSDPEGQTLTLVAVSQPAHGTVSFNADGTLTYKSSKRYSGSDSLSYQISDGQLTAVATVTIQVGTSTSDGSTSTSTGGGKGRK
ncbi:Ig-like domain-containing protein [Pseudaeromonas sp. ZJS20]|uniref:Ig-like domain-containing protein n=1 Tax=Pseudaeromonas aegiceratis TaxID=3153928 RepID=UPI00390C932C